MLRVSGLTNHICTSSYFTPQASSRVRFHLQVPQRRTPLCSRVMKIIDAAYRMTNFRGLADADPFIRIMEGCRKLDSAVWAPMKRMLDLKGWLRPFYYLHTKGVLFTYKSTRYLCLMYCSPSPSVLSPINIFKRVSYRAGIK